MAAYFQYVDNPLTSFLSVYPDLLPWKSRSAEEMVAAWLSSTYRTLRNHDSEGTWTLPVKTQALWLSMGLCGWTRRKDSFNKQVKKVTAYFLLIWLLTLNCKALVLWRDVKKITGGWVGVMQQLLGTKKQYIGISTENWWRTPTLSKITRINGFTIYIMWSHVTRTWLFVG